MDAQDGRVVTSQARKDVEEAYDEEQLGGSKGVFLVIQMEGCFYFWPRTPGKKNMESQHEGLEDDFLFQIYWFILLGGL